MKSNKEYKEIVSQITKLRNDEKDLVISNMPKFERGIIEAALEREAGIWKEIASVFAKHNISPSVITSIQSDNQPSQYPHRPNLACAGVKVILSYIVSPMDKVGKDGSMPDEVIEKIASIRKEVEELTRSLEEV